MVVDTRDMAQGELEREMEQAVSDWESEGGNYGYNGTLPGWVPVFGAFCSIDEHRVGEDDVYIPVGESEDYHTFAAWQEGPQYKRLSMTEYEQTYMVLL